MAKLNGVKTLDMQNGLITKIYYNGSEYEKVDDKAQVGDIVQTEYPHRDITKGGFYEVVSEGFNTIIDDVGDLHSNALEMGPNVVFRNVIELKEGDKVILSGRSQGGTDVDGKLGTLRRIDDTHASVLLDDLFIVVVVYRNQVKKYDVTKGVFYDEVRRIYTYHGFKEGERVLVSGNSKYGTPTEGKICRVLAYVDNEYVCVDSEDGQIKEALVYPKQLTRLDGWKPKVGDIVVLIGNKAASTNDVGDIGMVTEVEGTDAARVEVPFGPKIGTFSYVEDLRPATEAEVAEYEKKKTIVKEGDYIRVTLERPYFDKEKVYEVVKRGGSLGIIDDEGDFSRSPLLYRGAFNLVSKEEIPFSKFGRKFNEFKVGDIVEITKYQNGAPVGTIVRVNKVEFDSVQYDFYLLSGKKELDFGASKTAVKLIAPVEVL